LAATEVAPATVLVFLSTSCPIANRYAPEIERLYERFKDSGIRFYLVYPNDSESAIRDHLRQYGYSIPTLRDAQHRLAARSRVRATPEVAVFVGRERRLVYHGRIDDRFVDFAKERPAPTQRDLEQTLEAVVAGRGEALEPRSTDAFGCVIE
jgi:thiol-disulfide isomerase/thioredoxin